MEFLLGRYCLNANANLHWRERILRSIAHVQERLFEDAAP